jgi:hypothetical protein
MKTKHLGEVVVEIAQTKRLKQELKHALKTKKRGDSAHLRTQLKTIKDGLKASKGTRDTLIRQLIKEKTRSKQRTVRGRTSHPRRQKTHAG